MLYANFTPCRMNDWLNVFRVSRKLMNELFDSCHMTRKRKKNRAHMCARTPYANRSEEFFKYRSKNSTEILPRKYTKQ